VRVSLMELSFELEQELDARMELLDPVTGLLAVGDTSDRGELGIRLAYHLHYKPQEQLLEHWVEYPSSHHRLPLVERDALRAVVVEDNPPLQLRPEGTFRRIAAEPDPDALTRTLEDFAKDIAEATNRLTNSDEVQAALELVAGQGTKWVLALEDDSPGSTFGFTAEDGSMAALLRAVQPTLELDADVGRLPLASHGSTTRSVLAAAEASAVAHTDHAIVLADDFGDQLDASATEYLASRLQQRKGQLWLSTRRSEAVSAFEATDLLRLTRHEGSRQQFQLSPTSDRKERGRRRYMSTLLAPAMSVRTVVLLEGPHDLEAYRALDRRRHRELSKQRRWSL
jgi:putative ATP-dependent endonuclease of the OLD family